MGFIEAGASDFFVPRGYVHVIANVRGTGGSDQDVDPDGTSHDVTAGYLRASLRKVDEDASRVGAPVLPCREPVAVPIGQDVQYRIPLVPNARRFKAGHRIRLHLTSDDQDPKAPAIMGFRHATVGTSTINSIRSQSRLLLPVLPKLVPVEVPSFCRLGRDSVSSSTRGVHPGSCRRRYGPGHLRGTGVLSVRCEGSGAASLLPVPRDINVDDNPVAWRGAANVVPDRPFPRAVGGTVLGMGDRPVMRNGLNVSKCGCAYFDASRGVVSRKTVGHCGAARKPGCCLCRGRGRLR
jgi:X-Pro dipeptidyl-peptidase-like protein